MQSGVDLQSQGMTARKISTNKTLAPGSEFNHLEVFIFTSRFGGHFVSVVVQNTQGRNGGEAKFWKPGFPGALFGTKQIDRYCFRADLGWFSFGC